RHHHPIGYRKIPSVCYFDRQRMNVVLTAGKAGLGERISYKFLDACRTLKHPTCRRAMNGAIRREGSGKAVKVAAIETPCIVGHKIMDRTVILCADMRFRYAS